MFTGNTVTDVLIVAAIVAFGVVALSGIGLFCMWIKYSWMERTNTLGYTGEDLTNKLFGDAGINPEIKKSFWYSKFWNHNKKRNTYRLRPWTANRSSVWTMMEASQQAYATINRDKKSKTFWTAFRLPQIVSLAGTIVGVGIIAWGIYAAKQAGSLDDMTWEQWFKVWIGFSVILAATTYALVARALILRREVPKMLEGVGFSDHEMRVITSIFTWALVYAIANAILQSIRVALEILSRANNNSNK